MSKSLNAYCTQFVHISMSRANDEAERRRSLRMSSDQALRASPAGEQRVGPQLVAMYTDESNYFLFQSDRYPNAYYYKNWSHEEEFTESRHAM